jgi:hypothetical protein
MPLTFARKKANKKRPPHIATAFLISQVSEEDSMIPQAITDAITALQTAKDAGDSAVAAKGQTATSLVTATNNDTTAAAAVAAAGSDIDTKRKQLEAILDSYYTLMGTIPTAPAATTATTTAP